MSIDLDPKEVLQHLHSLGYCNISPELLKEFIRDLKKLIRYDQKRGLLNRQRQGEGTRCHKQNINREDMEADLLIHHFDGREECRTYRRTSPVHNPHPQRYPDECDSVLTDGSEQSIEQNKHESRAPESTRKENIPPRPPSSFIRPGNVGGRCKPKSDPVALYHYYQGIWSQNPQPGEDPRAQLRWNIRHQMMGKQKQQQQTCGCPCCEYRLVENRLPRKCPLNRSRYVPRPGCSKYPDEQTFNPDACSSPLESNHDFNEEVENPEDELPPENNNYPGDRKQSGNKELSHCESCGKRLASKSSLQKDVIVKDSNEAVNQKNSFSVQGKVKRIRVVTEINLT